MAKIILLQIRRECAGDPLLFMFLKVGKALVQSVPRKGVRHMLESSCLIFLAHGKRFEHAVYPSLSES